MSESNARLQSELESLKNDKQIIDDMRVKIDNAEEERTHFEKTMMSTYERKLSLMQMNKDVTIDGLRKELTKAKEKQKETEAELSSKIRSLQNQRTELEAELKAKMKHKNSKIEYLEKALATHEQMSGDMKDELDQLQSGMESVSVTRRAEIEELQEELMDVKTKATKYEREITALKMKLEEQKLRHKDDVSRFKETISTLESDTPMMRDVQSQRDDRRSVEMSDKLENLKWQLSTLQEENHKLRNKLDKVGDPRTSKNDKWRNSALQEQVFVLTQRLKELEGDTDSVKSSSSRRTSKTSKSSVMESPRRIPRSPGGSRLSFRKDSASRSSGKDDISTHTEMTF